MNENVNVIIGAMLKELRNRNGYSMVYVANRIQKSDATIAHYETGRNAVDIATLKKLCILYGVDVKAFLAEVCDRI